MNAKLFLSAVLALRLTLTPIRAAVPAGPGADGAIVAETRAAHALEEAGTPDAPKEVADADGATVSDAPKEAARLLAGDAALSSGTCGKNLTWALDAEGTLTISGEGAMKNYTVINGAADSRGIRCDSKSRPSRLPAARQTSETSLSTTVPL